ncbi:hypothetical protein WG66_006102 [Moniliophthora roreri]|nr:hypothetical protein WG66_006102 [Moniliophthora roreri]
MTMNGGTMTSPTTTSEENVEALMEEYDWDAQLLFVGADPKKVRMLSVEERLAMGWQPPSEVPATPRLGPVDEMPDIDDRPDTSYDYDTELYGDGESKNELKLELENYFNGRDFSLKLVEVDVAAQDKTSQWSEQQLEKDIAEAEARRRGQLTQSISNPGGRAIPPLTRASRRDLLTPLQSPSLTSQPLTETQGEVPETRRTSTPSFTPIGSRTIEQEEEPSPNTPKPSDSDTLNISTDSQEELDPFQRLLQGLKNSPRSPKVQTETMAEDKKPSGSRPRREEPAAEEAVIGSAMPVQVVSAVKEVKAALPRAFTGSRGEAKRFLREVLIYVALNPKAFPDDRSKKLFLLSYMTDGAGEFWKNDKADLLLAFDPEAEKVTWSEFLDDFRTSFEPLDPALKAQLELKDLKMKERADEYTYQFIYLAKQTGYNDAAQIVAFKRGLPKSLVFKIMTRPEGAPTTIKDWINAAIIFDESYKQALEKMTKEERFAKIRALVNDQPKEDKDFLIDLMEQEGF